MSQLLTYLATSKSGRTKLISAYTESDAYQQAVDWAGDIGLDSFQLN